MGSGEDTLPQAEIPKKRVAKIRNVKNEFVFFIVVNTFFFLVYLSLMTIYSYMRFIKIKKRSC